MNLAFGRLSDLIDFMLLIRDFPTYHNRLHYDRNV